MKKQPQRTCMGCNEKKDKKELIRIVKNKEGIISIDRTGKQEGRGAYICDNIECLEKVIKSNIILYTITRLCNSAKGIEKIHVEDIIKLCNNNIGNKFLMPNKHIKVFIKNNKVTFSKED